MERTIEKYTMSICRPEDSGAYSIEDIRWRWLGSTLNCSMADEGESVASIEKENIMDFSTRNWSYWIGLRLSSKVKEHHTS